MTTTQDGDREAGERLRGDDADKPTQIPARGWWQVVRRAFEESSADNVPSSQPIVADQTPIGGFGLADLATCVAVVQADRKHLPGSGTRIGPDVQSEPAPFLPFDAPKAICDNCR